MRMYLMGVSIGMPTLAACASAGTAGVAATASRRADAVAALVGKAVVRRISPGDPTTKDFRVKRVTVTIAAGEVVAASCG